MTQYRIMAAGWIPASYLAGAVSCVVLGLLKILAGLQFWPYTVAWGAMSAVWFCLSFRLSRVPVMVFSAHGVDVLEAPVRRARHVDVVDIAGLQTSWLSGPQLVLGSGKSVALPYRMMSKSDRAFAAARIAALVTFAADPAATITLPVQGPQKPAASLPGGSGECEAPRFFSVSVAKLMVLSVCTLGLYEMYWFYRNWQLIRARERAPISPVWRSVFAIFFCYEFFNRVRDCAAATGSTATLHAGPLAAGWIVTRFLYLLPDPYWLVCNLTFLFLVPVQAAAMRVNDAVAPSHDRNSRFTGANWAGVVIGGLILVCGVMGTFLPDQ